MKTLVFFLLFVVAFSFYAEYVISRPINNLLGILATAGIIVLFILFMRHFIPFLIKKLRL